MISGATTRRIDGDARPALRRWADRTVLVTDLVGSTAISRSGGDDAFLDAVEAHHAIVRARLADRGGHEFSERGDGLLAWFERPTAAVVAALDIHDGFADETGPRPLEVRIGVATGRALVSGGRPHGSIPIRACRIVDVAGDGCTVVDPATADALRPHGLVAPATAVELRGLGAVGLTTIPADFPGRWAEDGLRQPSVASRSSAVSTMSHRSWQSAHR